VSETKTMKLNQMYLYQCMRKPGYVYKFCTFTTDKYRRVGCHRAGRRSNVTIRNAVVVPSTKHPEDDHRGPICEPIIEEGTLQIFLCISRPTVRKCYVPLIVKAKNQTNILHFGE